MKPSPLYFVTKLKTDKEENKNFIRKCNNLKTVNVTATLIRF